MAMKQTTSNENYTTKYKKISKSKAIPLQAYGTHRVWEVKAPRFRDLKVVGYQPYSRSVFTPGVFWYSLLKAESTPGI
jgi:hypothetical protein